jgi:hypothetical protein
VLRVKSVDLQTISEVGEAMGAVANREKKKKTEKNEIAGYKHADGPDAFQMERAMAVMLKMAGTMRYDGVVGSGTPCIASFGRKDSSEPPCSDS